MKQYWPGLPGFSSSASSTQPAEGTAQANSQVLDIELKTLKKNVAEQQTVINSLSNKNSDLKEQLKDSEVLVLALKEQLKEKNEKILELTTSSDEKNKSYSELRNLVTEKVKKISALEAQRDNLIAQLKLSKENEAATTKVVIDLQNTLDSKANTWKQLENDLQKRIGQLNSDYLTLQEDRQLLMSDIHALRDENAQLKSQNEDLVYQQSELKDILDSCRQEILKSADIKTDAKQYTAKARAVEQQKEDAQFCERFSLPETEFVIKCYYCVYRFINPGWFYITPSHICFEPLSMTILLGNKISFPILSIKNIKKVRMFYYLPGTDNGLEFTLNSSMKHVFGNFVKREKVLANIRNQALKCGHDIRVYEFGWDVPQIESSAANNKNGATAEETGSSQKDKEKMPK